MARSDTGPFALIPIWVLDLPVSHLALRVYAVHADWADRSGAHFHGRKAIALRLGVTVQVVDDAHRTLVAHGALRIERRKDAAGDPTSNRYVVCRTLPGVAYQETLPSVPGNATGGVPGNALTRSRSFNHQEASPEAGHKVPDVKLTKEQKRQRLAEVRQLKEKGA